MQLNPTLFQLLGADFLPLPPFKVRYQTSNFKSEASQDWRPRCGLFHRWFADLCSSQLAPCFCTIFLQAWEQCLQVEVANVHSLISRLRPLIPLRFWTWTLHSLVDLQRYLSHLERIGRVVMPQSLRRKRGSIDRGGGALWRSKYKYINFTFPSLLKLQL